MTAVRVRTRSGEGLETSPDNNAYDGADLTFFTILIDPPAPDGFNVREVFADGRRGPLRVEGHAKHWDGVTFDNATAGEIATYAAAEAEDENTLRTNRAKNDTDVHPTKRKTFKGIIKGVVDENNIQAARYNELRAEMLAATSLANLQQRIADNTQDMPTRTYEQAYTKLRNDVDAND